MKKRLASLFAAVLGVAGPLSSATTKPETPRLEFVKEFIRELSAVEEIRANGEQEQKGNPDATFRNIIHSGTLFRLEIGSEIGMLETMHLNEPFDELIPDLISFQKQKIAVWARMVEIGREFATGPKAGVDYAKLGAEMPELRARLEFLDESIFKAAPMVVATLIDMKEDSKHHVSHLIITKAERVDLLENINTSFGRKLDSKDQNYLVSAASVLKGFLLDGHKGSDEPWE